MDGPFDQIEHYNFIIDKDCSITYKAINLFLIIGTFLVKIFFKVFQWKKLGKISFSWKYKIEKCLYLIILTELGQPTQQQTSMHDSLTNFDTALELPMKCALSNSYTRCIFLGSNCLLSYTIFFKIAYTMKYSC